MSQSNRKLNVLEMLYTIKFRVGKKCSELHSEIITESKSHDSDALIQLCKHQINHYQHFNLITKLG